MRMWLLFLVFTVASGLILGTLMGFDSGYVLISWSNYTIETSVWFYLGATVVGMLVLYFLMRVSLLILGSDWRFNEWRAQRRNQRARRQTTRGLLSLAQGQWRRAERLLTLNADDSDTPLINYLAAARAAYEQGKNTAADEWLSAANQSTKGAELAVGLTQAELLSSRGQKEQALAVLLKLRQHNPRHAYLLKLLVRVYVDLEDWLALNELLPVIRRHTNIGDDKIRELEEKVHLQMLERASRSYQARGSNAGAGLSRVYNDMPRSARNSLLIAKRYIELLIEDNEEELAEQELRGILKHIWHDDLIILFGKVHGKHPNKQYIFAEQQLIERPNDPLLLLALGRIALRLNDLDKAREYLDTGLRIRNLPELHLEMASLCLAEGNETLACEHFRLALLS